MLSYSLVIETENLSVADNERLWCTLHSLEKAIARIWQPDEVLLYNSGDVSPEMIAELGRKYEWVSPLSLPPGETYYEAKMRGAREVPSEIVVFVDSDCSYNEDWLSGLLEPFENPDINVVAGETGFSEPGPYSLALSIVHAFDGFSGRQELYPVNYYYANNVAFRRSFLMDSPIPTDLPLYRSGCYRHSVEMRSRGETIWTQPRSRAVHAAPEGLSHFFWRFLLFGRDRTVRRQLALGDDAPRVISEKRGARHFISRRLTRALKHQPEQWKWLPIAMLVVMFAELLIWIGKIMAIYRPQQFIGHFSKIEGVHYPTVQEFQSKQKTMSS
ncbi:MAG: glycosyltransferase [Chromatiales bacterium]